MLPVGSLGDELVDPPRAHRVRVHQVERSSLRPRVRGEVATAFTTKSTGTTFSGATPSPGSGSGTTSGLRDQENAEVVGALEAVDLPGPGIAHHRSRAGRR